MNGVGLDWIRTMMIDMISKYIWMALRDSCNLTVGVVFQLGATEL